MKKTIALLCVVLLYFGCEEQIQTESKLITPEELQELAKLDDVQLIDVRTPEEYEEGYIEGFENIDFHGDNFDLEIEKLDKTKPVVVYCRSGKRSASCATKMLEKGFVKIYDLDGGITKWMSEGYDVIIE